MTNILHTIFFGHVFLYYAFAHVEMTNPLSFKSRHDPINTDIDYTLTAPLLADGSNYPCKLYHQLAHNTNAAVVRATYAAGNSYELTLEGSATHNGGSCQISLSYDDGTTFKVIKSMIGGCPIPLNYNFTIPAYAPASTSALLAWTWFNNEGNREMYMGCARVEIRGTQAAGNRRALSARQAPMNSLPDAFVCNVANGCSTVEGYDVQFPDPGTDVLKGVGPNPELPGLGFFGGSQTATIPAASSSLQSPLQTPTWTYSWSGITNGTLGPNASDVPPTSTTLMSSTATSTSTTPVIVHSTVSTPITPGSKPAWTSADSSTSSGTFQSLSFTTSRTAASLSASLLSGPCTPGMLACNSLASWSQCVGSSYIFMGPVPAGMQCANNAISHQNDGPCTPNGQIVCKSPNAFYICDHGGLINMGPVAPGTHCVNNVIQRR